MEKYESLKAMKELELREWDVPTPKTEEELLAIISNLVEREHDYGTCVEAVANAAVAAYNYVADRLGIAGFQASCADLEILSKTRRMKDGFMILDYNHLLYPQYCDDEHFPSWQRLVTKNVAGLQKRAKELLDDSKNKKWVSDKVRAHWEWLISLPCETKDDAVI